MILLVLFISYSNFLDGDRTNLLIYTEKLNEKLYFCCLKFRSICQLRENNQRIDGPLLFFPELLCTINQFFSSVFLLSFKLNHNGMLLLRNSVLF